MKEIKYSLEKRSKYGYFSDSVSAQLSSLTPDLVTRRYPDIEILLTKEWAQPYLQCVGDKQVDLSQDDVELPYSFYSCLREGEFNIFKDLGIDLKQLLHLSQSFHYFAKPRLNEKIISRVSILKVVHRKLGGNEVVFLELQNEYFRNSTEAIAKAEGTVIVRSAEEKSPS